MRVSDYGLFIAPHYREAQNMCPSVASADSTTKKMVYWLLQCENSSPNRQSSHHSEHHKRITEFRLSTSCYPLGSETSGPETTIICMLLLNCHIHKALLISSWNHYGALPTSLINHKLSINLTIPKPNPQIMPHVKCNSV